MVLMNQILYVYAFEALWCIAVLQHAFVPPQIHQTKSQQIQTCLQPGLLMCTEFRVQVLLGSGCFRERFRVQEFSVQGFSNIFREPFRVQGFSVQVVLEKGFAFRSSAFRDSAIFLEDYFCVQGFRDSGFSVQGFRIQRSGIQGFSVQGFRDSGFSVQGFRNNSWKLEARRTSWKEYSQLHEHVESFNCVNKIHLSYPATPNPV